MQRRGDAETRRHGDAETRRTVVMREMIPVTPSLFQSRILTISYSPVLSVSASPFSPRLRVASHFHISNVVSSQSLHEFHHLVVAITRVVRFDHEEEVVACR
jgi:hypothetical protein